MSNTTTSLPPNDRTVRTLTPSFWRTCLQVGKELLPLVPVLAIGDRLQHGHWSGEWLPMIFLAMLFFAPLTYFFSVPRWVQWSGTECQIKPWLEDPLIFSWAQLSGYGGASSGFYLKFSGTRRLRVFPGAFPPEEWRAFMAFLQTNYPLRKTSWLVRNFWGGRVDSKSHCAH